MLLVTWDNYKTLDWGFNHFRPEELLRVSHYNCFIWSPELEDTLTGADLLRDVVEAPLIVTSACRFRGSETSQHFFKQFNALDVYNPDLNSYELMQYVEKLNIFTGRGVYPYNNTGFIHIDTRFGLRDKENGRVIRWYFDQNGAEHVVNEFSEELNV